ncbi:monocarboxylate transporter 13-like [Ixodes scapularis]
MDSARSWVLAVACAWINIFSFAMFRAAPVIYVGIMGTYHVTRQQAAWPLFITLVIYTTAALGAGLLTRCVAVWKLTLSGCLLSSLSVSVCFFANGIPYLSFFLGIAHGCGIALLTLCNTVISQNFLRYRTVASGISSAGITLGSFLYPVLVQFLFDEYGTRGGLLLCGGVMLNATAGALLHRLPPTAQREPVASLDLLARIGSGWITDKRMLKKSVMMALNFLLWGTSLFLMPLCYSFYLHALLAFLAGWCNGATIIMIPVLLMEHVGLEKFSVCFGASFLLCGLPLLMIPGLIGYFRDSLGNYQRLFFLLGGLTLLNGLLWLRSFSQEKAKTVSEGESKNGSIIRSSHSLQNSEG